MRKRGDETWHPHLLIRCGMYARMLSGVLRGKLWRSFCVVLYRPIGIASSIMYHLPGKYRFREKQSFSTSFYLFKIVAVDHSSKRQSAEAGKPVVIGLPLQRY